MYEIIAFAVLYVIEAIVAVLYLDYLYERKRNNWKLFLSFALAYCALFGISRFKMTTLNAISFTVINACLIAYNYRCKLTMATVHSFMLCFLVMCAEILVSLVIAWFGYDFSAYLQNFSVMLTLIVWSKFLYVIFVVVTARFFKPKKRENIEPGTTFLFCILPIFSAIAATAIIYIGMRTGVDSSKAIVITIAISSLLIMNLLFAGINEYVQKVNYEKTMLQLSIQKDQADADHYKAMQEQFENQRVLVHDIRNHLGTMEAMANRNEIEQIRRYLKNLNKTFLNVPQARVSNDPVLNAMVLRFREECKNEGIVFSCDIRDNTVSFMDAIDITTLFGNMLTNAKEAARDAIEPKIELVVCRNVGEADTMIVLNNTCRVAPKTDEKGNYISQKQDRLQHGIGLKSIRRVVCKYNGMETMDYDPEQKQFTHVITFVENAVDDIKKTTDEQTI